MKNSPFVGYLSACGFLRVGRVMLRGIGLLILQLTLGMDLVRGAEVKQAWQAEWEWTVEAAKREGQVNVYIWSTTAPLDAGVFQKRYRGIKVVGVAGRGGQIEQRLLTERRAGKYLADVVAHGVNPNVTLFYPAKILDPIKPALILPEVLDKSKWWRGKHHYADPEGSYVFAYVGAPQYGSISYNTNRVDPKEFKSFWDFLNPKWEGKIEARDISTAGEGSGAMRFFYHNPELGPKFIRRLFSEMDITLFRDPRQGADWLGKGRFAICFFCSNIRTAQQQGLPVDSFRLMEEGAGMVEQGHSLALVNKAPHPNAAKVFVNWFLSREGQITFQRTYSETSAPNSLRIDIPKDRVLPEHLRIEGVKYLELFVSERIDIEPVLKIFKEALDEARKRK